jgi:predicted nucleic acid-binding protein
VLFDTDILIWIQRGNFRAAALVEKEEERCISILTYMELLQGAKEKRQHELILDFLREYRFRMLPLSENIGHRAAIYIEEYSLSYGLRAGDAMIAATATESRLTLCTSNVRHYRPIKELKLRILKP